VAAWRSAARSRTRAWSSAVNTPGSRRRNARSCRGTRISAPSTETDSIDDEQPDGALQLHPAGAQAIPSTPAVVGSTVTSMAPSEFCAGTAAYRHARWPARLTGCGPRPRSRTRLRSCGGTSDRSAAPPIVTITRSGDPDVGVSVVELPPFRPGGSAMIRHPRGTVSVAAPACTERVAASGSIGPEALRCPAQRPTPTPSAIIPAHEAAITPDRSRRARGPTRAGCVLPADRIPSTDRQPETSKSPVESLEESNCGAGVAAGACGGLGFGLERAGAGGEAAGARSGACCVPETGADPVCGSVAVGAESPASTLCCAGRGRRAAVARRT
jgi:hypothetical protein